MRVRNRWLVLFVLFVALPGGMLGQRFGAERIVSGVGAVLVNVLATKMVADWFAGREIVTAMVILVASWPLGLALGLLLLTPLAAG